MSQQTGFIHAVPCPHCDHKNNLTSVHQDMGADFGGGGGLEVGMKVSCDKCNRVSTITGLFRDPYVFTQGAGKKVAGPSSNVPCPYCGKHQDFRGVMSDLGDSFERGVTAECDHCGNKSIVEQVVKAMRVRLA